MRGPDRPLVISRQAAQRLAIASQRLSSPRPRADAATVMSLLRALRYVQLDPVSVVAPSHEIVLWSRLGMGANAVIDDLLSRQRKLFEYSLAAAAIVLTEDWPMYRAFMDAYPTYPEMSTWVGANHALHQHILDRLAARGPLPTSGFQDVAVVPWKSSGWTAGRNVERMLQFLWLRGTVMVAGREGRERIWDLTESLLPVTVGQAALEMDQALTTAVEHAMRALGVARQGDIRRYFFGLNWAPPLGVALDKLLAEGQLVPVAIEGEPNDQPTYIHVESLEALAAIQAGRWAGRTVLLSPFDNLICDRDRVQRLWGFSFKNEMYVPKTKRQYGYYLLPILHGDQLIGRVAPRLDRRRGVLEIEGLYLEPSVRPTAALAHAVQGQLDELATFAGATAVHYGDILPPGWPAQR